MSEICENWSKWLLQSRFSYMSEDQKTQTLNWLLSVRDAVLGNADIKPDNTIIDIGTGTGLLGFGALDLINENGKIIFSDKFEDCIISCQEIASQLNINKPIDFLVSDALNLKLADNSVDRAVMRSVIVHILDKNQTLSEVRRILKPNGIFSAFEPVIKSNTRYMDLVEEGTITDFKTFKKAEDEMMSDINNPLTNFDEQSLNQSLKDVGFNSFAIAPQITASKYIVLPNMVEKWMTTPQSPGSPTMRDKFLTYFEESKVNNFMQELDKTLVGKEVEIKSNVLFIKAIK